MLTNYLKIAFRNLLRNKAFSFINIFGLAVGLTTCLLIMLYILDEISYDKQFKDAGRIYRVASVAGNGESWAATPAPLAQGLETDFSEIEKVTRLLKFPTLDKMLLKAGDDAGNRQFYESNGYYADSSFFQLFDYDFKAGDPLTALSRPNSIVISEKIAGKLFGKEDPVGKPVKVGLNFGEFTYTVQGVFKDTRAKSHIPVNFFLSMRNGDIGGWVKNQTNWANNNVFYTYIKLRETANPGSLEKKLQPFLDRRGGADLKASGISKRLFLQPLKDIYLRSDLGNEIASNGNIKYLYILSSIAVFILFIACINFMNLSTARSEKRAREVGVRKVMGAEKKSLIFQFLGESFIMCLIALFLALILSWLLLPIFDSLSQKELHPFSEPRLILWITGLTIGTGLLTGLYPAFYLSAFKPVSVLKGRLVNNYSAAFIRKGLVIFQFTISICLIVGAIVIWQQLKFLRNQNLGFNKDQQVVLPLQSDMTQKNYFTLKNELLKNAHIRTVTSGSTYPGIQNLITMLIYPEGRKIGDAVDIHFSTVENDYIETLGFTMLYGRTFSKEYTADSNSIILNETALKALGYEPEHAVGKRVYFDWQNVHHTLQIVGICKDFHAESLHSVIRPFGFATTFFSNKYDYLIAGFKTNDYPRLLSEIEQTWNRINPNSPFEYSFIDQDFQKNYEKDERNSHITGYFTVIAILIACLGLFGLSAFSAEQRTREIGIRKVLGASALNLVMLLSRDFIRLILVAIVIALPVAWFGMNRWLQDFAYKIQISWWMLLVAGLLSVLIALVTVSFQAIKAALTNPTNSLKAE